MGGDGAAARHLAAHAFDDEAVGQFLDRDAAGLEARRDRGQPVAFLDAQFLQARASPCGPRAKAAATARIGYSSIIDGRAFGRHLDPLERGRTHFEIADLLAAALVQVGDLDVSAHLAQRLDAGRCGAD